MNRPRLSLIGLMGAIALLAVGIAAFRIPWLPLRTSALFTLVVFILLTAILGSLLNRGASWIGFSLFGCCWLVISFVSLEIGPKNSTADRIPVPMPIASMWLVEFCSSVLGSSQAEQGESVTMILNSKGGHSLVSHSLVQECHLCFSLLAACLGGLLARRFDDRRPRSSPDGAGRSDPSSGEEARKSS